MKDWYEFMDRTTRPALITGAFPELNKTHLWWETAGMACARWARPVLTSSGWVPVAIPKQHRPYKDEL